MAYRFREGRPGPGEYVALRDAAGMKPRTEMAARRGLPNTLYAVTIREESEVEDEGDSRTEEGSLTTDTGNSSVWVGLSATTVVSTSWWTSRSVRTTSGGVSALASWSD